MADKSYVFKLLGDASGLQTATEAAATSLGVLADNSDAVAKQQAASAAAGDKFVQALRSQVDSANKTGAELLEMRAAQLGVTEAASPLIAAIDAQAQVSARAADAAKRLATEQAAEASALNAAAKEQAAAAAAGDRFVASLEAQAGSAGRTGAQLLQLKAAQLGVSDAARPYIAQIEAQSQAQEREAGAAQKAAAAEKALGNIRAAAQAEQRAQFTTQQQFVQALEAEVSALGKSRSALLGEKAARLGVTEATSASIQKLAAHEAELKAAGDATHKFSFETAASKRELLVLAHELSQGNYKRFGGSLLVLAEQTGAATALFNPLTLAVGGAVAAVGLFAYGALRGYLQLGELNKQLLLTGNYAGVTGSSFDALARKVQTSTNATIGASRAAAEAVVGSGVFGPKLIEPTTEAVVRLAALSGKSAEDVVADFAKMGDGVARYAAEHNKSLHVISAAQYEQIKALEDAGKAEEAQGVYLNALNSRLAEHEKSIGTVEKAWRAAKNGVSDYIQRVADVGKGSTIGRQLQLARARVDDLQRGGDDEPANGEGFTIGSDSDSRRAAALAEAKSLVATLEQSEHLADQVAKATADSNKRQEDAVAGSQVVSQIEQEIDKRSKATKEIEKYTVAVAKMRAGNDPKAPTPEREAQVIQGIKDANKTPGDRAAARLDTRYTDRSVALQQDGERLKAEIASYQQYGHAIDTSRVAVLNLEIAQGKLKGLSAARIAQLRSEAAADDDLAKQLDVAKLNAELDKRINKIGAAAQAQALNTRETRVATELAIAENAGLVKGSAAYETYAARVTEAVNAEEDQVLVRKLRDEQLANDQEVAKLDEETRALGLSTIERQKAIAVLKLEAEAKKDIVANPGQESQILDDLAKKRDALTSAIQRNYDATRQFDTGFNSALQKYQEDATNDASYASHIVEGGLSRAEDALTKFAQTGKLKLGDLWKFMADEFIRQQVRMAIASATASKSGGLLSIVGSLFGVAGGAASGGGVDPSTIDGDAAAGGIALSQSGPIDGEPYAPTQVGSGKASGGAVEANSLHPVNEKGPEIFSQGGSDYLMVGGSGGFIRPMSAAEVNNGGSGGGTQSNAPTVIVEDHNNSNVQVQQEKGPNGEAQLRLIVKQAVDQAHRQVAADIGSGNGKVSNAMRGRGLSLDGANPRRA